MAKGIGTKNVPDAIKWHFVTIRSMLLKSETRQSSEKIKEYIAIPILLRAKIKTYNQMWLLKKLIFN